MTREELKALKAHYKRKIQQFELAKKIIPVTPNDWKRYEERKLILELLEQESILNEIRKIVNEWKSDSWTDNLSYECMIKIAKLVEPQEGIIVSGDHMEVYE